MWGGGQQDGYPSHSPPPQEAELSPNSAEFGRLTSSHYLAVVPENANRPPSVRQGKWEDANGPPSVGQQSHVTSVVTVRERHFDAYSSINGYIKKPFSQTRGGKPSSTLLQCQSLPTSFLRDVRSEYPALYISRVKGLFSLSRRCFIRQATSLQRTVNIKNKAGYNSTRGTVSSLLFSRWKVLLHTVYIFNIFNVDWG